MLHAGSLPPHYTDPFDRLLIAQAMLENMTLLTADGGRGLPFSGMALA